MFALTARIMLALAAFVGALVLAAVIWGALPLIGAAAHAAVILAGGYTSRRAQGRRDRRRAEALAREAERAADRHADLMARAADFSPRQD